ncbi:MAG: thioredoxin [Anaerolineae bacterium]|nr:MAG: thioredoxin [Anaerolineae bacterium]
MSDILEIHEEQFQSEVLDASGPVLVDFSAVWCQPCKMLDPVVDELAGDWEGSVKFVKIDVDHNPMVAMNYQVMGVPTLLLFKGGQVQERLVGFKPKDHIVAKLSPHLELA